MIELARTRHEVVCEDGWKLDVELVTGPSPRAVAVVGHAMMVDRRTLDVRGDGLVSALARAGIAVVWPDLRGHGRSGPRAGEGGEWNYDDLVEQDTPALLEFARAQFAGLPLFVVGHSLFGHVVVAWAGRHAGEALARAVRGFVVLAANSWIAECEPSRAVWIKKRALMEAMGVVTRVAGRFPSRRLRVGNNDEAAGYVRQFVAWTRGAGWQAADGFSYRQGLSSLAAPLCSIGATGDLLAAEAVCLERFYDRVPRREMVLAGARAKQMLPPGWTALPLPFDPGHMGIVTDARSAPAWQLAAEFILREA